MASERLKHCVYEFREGGDHNGQLLFQAKLFERGKPVAEYDLWLSIVTKVLTDKVYSFDRGNGFASGIIRRTIPGELERIAAKHGSFIHRAGDFTPQGVILTELMLSLDYQQEGNYLVKNY